MNKNNLFDCSQVNFKEFADEEWQKWNDDEFGVALSDINNPLLNNTKEENSLKFPHSIMSLSTPSLTLLQTSGSNGSIKEDTASVEALNLENTDTQSKEEFYDIWLKNRTTAFPDFINNDAAFMHARPDNEPAQFPSGFVEEEIDDSLINSLTLSSTVSTHQSSHTWSSVKYNISDYFDNIQYDSLKKISKINVITAKSSIPKSH